MIVVFFLLTMVNAVFAVAISEALVATPSSVIPAWSAIVVAVAIGVLLYRVGVGILWPTVVGTIILYAVIYVGDQVPVELPVSIAGLGPQAQWILILFAYAAVASMLPVWLLLQPRDYINGIQLIIGLGILYSAVLIASPTVVAPAINPNLPPATPPIFPLLFVTIACGAISGFHGLVSSGTTSKQLNKEPDARFAGISARSGRARSPSSRSSPRRPGSRRSPTGRRSTSTPSSLRSAVSPPSCKGAPPSRTTGSGSRSPSRRRC